MQEPHVHAAHTALRVRDGRTALDALRGHDDPSATWLRVLAAATLGDAVATSVALRQAARRGPLPDTALVDVARPYCEAVLDQLDSLPAWRVLATAVYTTTDDDPVPHDDLELAWSMLTRALDHEAEDPRRPALLLGLGGVARRLDRPDLAKQIARACQEGARRIEDADTYRGATLLLAEVCCVEDEVGLADEVVRHGTRQLAGFAPAASPELAVRWREIREAWTAGG